MQALEILTLVLVNVALGVYLCEKGLATGEHRRLHRLVNDHPEMKGLNPDEESLFVFESDVSLKAFVLNNDEPGKTNLFM